MQSAVRNYLQTQVSTTTQGDLVIMLFDAALKYLHQAREKIVEKNYAQKGILISKALDILAELQGSLNINKGGDLADRLQKLYFFCSSRLLTANLKMDVTKIDEVVGILSGLRDAFSEANAMVTTKAVPTSATQPPRIGAAGTALGSTPLSGSTAAMPIGGLAPQAAAGRYAAAPRPTAPPVASVAAATAAALTAPAPAARQELPVASATPPPIPEPADEPQADLPLEAAQAPRPAVSPVRRVMAAYGATRPNA